ncbi:hypothetical protein ACJMK2_010080 [Sinanodonta woodiana]|uniref:N4BP1 first type I KH-domain domain-containing protein n=1 Tax=Sinanodonta woodiana TaxID=1069815 RepID=A0ABD3VE82_SINWO
MKRYQSKIERMYSVHVSVEDKTVEEGTKQWITVEGECGDRKDAKEYILAICSPNESHKIEFPPFIDIITDEKLEEVEKQTNAFIVPSDSKQSNFEVCGSDLAVTLALSMMEEMFNKHEDDVEEDGQIDNTSGHLGLSPEGPRSKASERLSMKLERALSEHSDGTINVNDYSHAPESIKRVLVQCLHENFVEDDIDEDQLFADGDENDMKNIVPQKAKGEHILIFHDDKLPPLSMMEEMFNKDEDVEEDRQVDNKSGLLGISPEDPIAKASERLSMKLERALTEHSDGTINVNDYSHAPESIKRVLVQYLCENFVEDDINEDQLYADGVVNDKKDTVFQKAKSGHISNFYDNKLPTLDSKVMDKMEVNQSAVGRISEKFTNTLISKPLPSSLVRKQHECLRNFGVSVGYKQAEIEDALKFVDEKTRPSDFLDLLKKFKAKTDTKIETSQSLSVNKLDKSKEKPLASGLNRNIQPPPSPLRSPFKRELPGNYKERLLRDFLQEDPNCSREELIRRNAERQNLEQPSCQEQTQEGNGKFSIYGKQSNNEASVVACDVIDQCNSYEDYSQDTCLMEAWRPETIFIPQASGLTAIKDNDFHNLHSRLLITSLQITFHLHYRSPRHRCKLTNDQCFICKFINLSLNKLIECDYLLLSFYISLIFMDHMGNENSHLYFDKHIPGVVSLTFPDNSVAHKLHWPGSILCINIKI